MSYFRTGGPDKEHRTNLSPPTRRAQERSKGDATCPTTSQSPPQWHPFWLSNACTTRKFPESGWLANDNLEINPNTINPSLRGTGQSCAWLPLSCCSLPRHPFPTKSLAVSAHVSPETIHVWVLDKSPFSGPGRGFLFLQQYHFVIRWEKKSLPGWTFAFSGSYVTPRGMDRLWGRILRSVFLRRNNLVNLSHNALLGKISMSGSFNLKLLQDCAYGHLFSCILKPTTIHRIKSRLWLFQRNYKHES